MPNSPIAFPIGLLVFSASIFVLPTAFDITMGALIVFLLGIYASFRAAIPAEYSRPWIYPALILVVLLTWLSWFFLPVTDLGKIVNILVRQNSYEIAISKIDRDVDPKCGDQFSCSYDEIRPAYVFFSYRSRFFYTAQEGILYMPETDKTPDQERIKQMGLRCDLKPIWSRYFACETV